MRDSLLIIDDGIYILQKKLLQSPEFLARIVAASFLWWLLPQEDIANSRTRVKRLAKQTAPK
jgi:hypothetical protein